MKSPVIKRSIVIAGHKTSVSLEDAFWKGLKEIADDRDVTLSDLVSSIDTDRQHGNLSSAIRLFVLDHYRNHTPIPSRARGDARPDRNAGGDVSSASRVVRAAQAARPSRSPRCRARGAARGFGAAGIVIGGGSAGAWAPPDISIGRMGRRRGRRASGATGAGCTAGSAGFGGAAPRAAPPRERPAPSHRSAWTAARAPASVSQLVSRLVSTVRLGAGSAPLSAIITAGCTAPGAGGGALSVSSASSMASARSTLTVACRSAPSAPITMSRKRACPALTLMAADAFDTGRPALSSAPVTNSRMRLPSVGMPSSTARVTAPNTSGIEADKPRLFERDGAEAGQRADERGGAAAGTFDLGLQRQTAGRRRAIGAGEDRAELGVGEADAKPRRRDRRRRLKPRAGRRGGPCRVRPRCPRTRPPGR